MITVQKIKNEMKVNETITINGTTFRAKAVVMHQGELHSGHYFTYVFEDPGWVKLSD